MSESRGASTGGIIIITSIISILLTIIVGMVIISQFGRETVAVEVSPFVEGAKDVIDPTTPLAEPDTEADIIMDGVAKNQGSSVLLYTSNASTTEFLGRGILATSNGYIITDANIINASSTYSIAVPGTKDRLVASVVRIVDDLAVLKITISTSLVAAFGRNVPVMNDVVVAVSGDEKMRIGTGIVTESEDDIITTNIYGNITPGSVLVAKSGYAVGISTAKNQKAGAPSFRLLTDADIDRLTKVMDSQVAP